MADVRSDPERIARSVDDARAIILRGTPQPLSEVEAPLVGALGRVLARPLLAALDSPPFATSAMDGFAIRAEDARSATGETPVRLPVVGIQPAGAASVITLPAGAAIRIMTGAPCPTGADAVVPFEQTRELPGAIVIGQPIPAGANIRPQAEDYRVGHRLLEVGATLTPACLALLAANGHASVLVRPAAKVAVIAAGQELRPPGSSLAQGQIWDSNSIMLTSLCGEEGAAVVMSAVVSDREDEIVAALVVAERADVDLIITVGGISAGDYDHLKHVLIAHGEIELWDVAMRPGRPLAFGRLAGVPVIGLPGNPAAAFVSFHQFVRPLLARMMGRSIDAPSITATVTESFQNRGGRRAFIRVEVTGTDEGYQARSAGAQGTANILSLARANGLLVILETVAELRPGDTGQVQLLGSAIQSLPKSALPASVAKH